MPEKTMEAVFDHGVVPANSITGHYVEAQAILDAIAAQGVSYDEATELLEAEGVDKFNISWAELVESVETALKAAK
jgi:transaldolase